MKYAKTEAGQQAFKARAATLTSRQRSAFILFDGKKTLAEVLATTAGLGVSEADVQHMVASGWLEMSLKLTVALAPPAVAQASAPTPSLLTRAQRYALAWPIATQITAKLGLRGFRLNLAVEAASGYEDMLLLLPKIQLAVGLQKALPLERALKD
ncbi:MAG: hypothetical protein WCH44_08925 [Betaproteobacteria bacterium]